jgi:hypothetical protein
MSPIDLSVSAIATAAAFADTPGGGSWRAISKARSQACGSARSCIQARISHSRLVDPTYLMLMGRLAPAVAAKAGPVPTHERLGPDDCVGKGGSAPVTRTPDASDALIRQS